MAQQTIRMIVAVTARFPLEAKGAADDLGAVKMAMRATASALAMLSSGNSRGDSAY